jgi:DNA-directed RNA polymerase specialized sigma24 family protein
MIPKSRSQIIAELYESKEIASALRKMQPASLREELRQEMFVSLCSISDDKFWSIYNNNGVGGLKFWLVRCMLNMIYSTSMNQPFFKNFRAKFESIEGFDNLADVEDNSKQEKELLFIKVEQNRKSLSWYEDRLLNTYMDLGFNQTEVSRRTKIPYQSVVKAITIIRKKLRDDR